MAVPYGVPWCCGLTLLENSLHCVHVVYSLVGTGMALYYSLWRTILACMA